jgi:hypothetical protein
VQRLDIVLLNISQYQLLPFEKKLRNIADTGSNLENNIADPRLYLMNNPMVVRIKSTHAPQGFETNVALL